MQVDTSGRNSVGFRSFSATAVRVAVSVIVAIIFVGLVAGCTGSGSAGTRNAKEAVATAGPGAGVDSTPVPCTTGQLAASVGPPSGAAGSSYFEVIFTNISPRSCSLYGYSGVSFRTSAQGHQVGAAAERQQGTVEPVTLAPEGRAYEMLRVVNAENYPESTCDLTPVAGLQVYPPGQTSALWAPATLEGCASPSEALIAVWPLASVPSG